MSTEVYWIGKTVIADWSITNPSTGAFVAGATVEGTVTLPDGTPAAMTVAELSDRYRATYEPTVAGLHAYRLEASGTAVSAEEGTFVVRVPLAGEDPITVDPTTDIGRIRLLCTDLNEVRPLFTDAQITAFLAMEGSVREAAALALETLASSEALLSKKIRTQDLQTDGPAVAKELRERARELRRQADAIDPTTGDSSVFQVVDYDPDAWLA